MSRCRRASPLGRSIPVGSVGAPAVDRLPGRPREAAQGEEELKAVRASACSGRPLGHPASKEHIAGRLSSTSNQGHQAGLAKSEATLIASSRALPTGRPSSQESGVSWSRDHRKNARGSSRVEPGRRPGRKVSCRIRSDPSENWLGGSISARSTRSRNADQAVGSVRYLIHRSAGRKR
jgi:hypothetical protein